MKVKNVWALPFQSHHAEKNDTNLKQKFFFYKTMDEHSVKFVQNKC